MSDRGNSEPVQSPKFLDLKDFGGIKKKVEHQLRAPEGKRFWRSLDELSGTPEFRDMMNREFPQAAAEWDDNVSRRNFMKLMGASLALAGLTSACAPKPEEKIIPYVQAPEVLVPGKPLFYASTMPWNGWGKGVLVEQHEGRPTKIEGNPEHPASLGATDVWGQATILTMYDPDRSQVLTRFGNVSSWGSFQQGLANALQYTDWNGPRVTTRPTPARVRVLTETVTSPTIKAQMAALKERFPNLVWHTYDAVGRDHTRAGAKEAFGDDVEPIYAFDRAQVVVSLDSNFFYDEPGSLRYARDFMELRRVRAVTGERRLVPRNRLYVVESSPTITGAKADHALRVRPEAVHAFAAALHRAVAAGSAEGIVVPGAPWFGPLVAELLAHKGRSAVVPGEYAPVEVHVLAHAINAALGNIASGPEDEKPVKLIPVVEANPVPSVSSIAELAQALRANEVDVLFILGVNPVYTAPPELDFAALLTNSYYTEGPLAGQGKLFIAHMGLYEDETARLCEWHIPETHFLEQWGDVRAYDGTASIVQPLIAPLYPACKSVVELLATVYQRSTQAGLTPPQTQPAVVTSVSGYDVVRAFWREALNLGDGFETKWTDFVRAGVIPGTEFKPKQVAFKGDLGRALQAPPPRGLTLMFRPDPNMWDGSWANNAWLQELPKPLTKLTWDNALMISPRAARDMGLTGEETGNVFRSTYSPAIGKTVDIAVGQRVLKGVPVWVLPGHPDGCATLHLGYGRAWAGRVGSPVDAAVGFNGYPLREGPTRWNVPAALTATGGSYPLAATQNHQVINHELNHKRELIIHGTSIPAVVDEFAHHYAERFGQGRGEHHGHDHGPVSPDKLDYDYEKNLTKARTIGLPIVPDDPSMSPHSIYPANPGHDLGHDPLYPAWGMVIDQTACIGCNACVVACQSENNVPVVGKGQVMVEREMHWLRIDTYYIGGVLDPANDPHGHDNDVNIASPDGTYFQPLLCMHCEKAPCELVCPVAATVHGKEGLNEMVYNRCIGTRYCSNNCPYKVRRFNFLKYVDDATPVLKLLRNPEVTVRSRGVMEKCTYCVQRINRGRMEAKRAEVRAAEAGASREEALKVFESVLNTIETACQQACPTDAIIFGNIADRESHVSSLKREPIGFQYGLLAELNTRPRTSYFAAINNPLPGTANAKTEGYDPSNTTAPLPANVPPGD